MTNTIIAMVLLCAAAPKEAAFPLFGGNKTEPAKVEELHKMTGLLNAEVTGIKARMDKLEVQVNAQAGLINKVQENSGSQVLTGDVGLVAVIGVAVLLVVLVVTYFRYQIAVHRSAGLILAASHNDDEALERAQQAPAQVQQKVNELVEAKNK